MPGTFPYRSVTTPKDGSRQGEKVLEKKRRVKTLYCSFSSYALRTRSCHLHLYGSSSFVSLRLQLDAGNEAGNITLRYYTLLSTSHGSNPQKAHLAAIHVEEKSDEVDTRYRPLKSQAVGRN